MNKKTAFLSLFTLALAFGAHGQSKQNQSNEQKNTKYDTIYVAGVFSRDEYNIQTNTTKSTIYIRGVDNNGKLRKMAFPLNNNSFTSEVAGTAQGNRIIVDGNGNFVANLTIKELLEQEIIKRANQK